MSRERNEEKKGLSPTQRKACVVLALCALAVVMSILAAWVLPTKLGLFAGGKDSYDPDATRWIRRWIPSCRRARRMTPTLRPAFLRVTSTP